jgi:hypothetical protein
MQPDITKRGPQIRNAKIVREVFLLFASCWVNTTKNGINFTSSTVNATTVYCFETNCMFRSSKGHLQMFLDTQIDTEL